MIGREVRGGSMRKLIVSEFISLDGVVEDPGGAEGFERGGWTSAYWNDELAAYKRDELFTADALLLGRVTYEAFAAAWPDASHEAGEYAERMNSLPKHVVSSTLTDLTWNNSHLLEGDLEKQVGRLKEQNGQDLLVFGSGQLVRTLIQLALVDQLRLQIYPVSVGRGQRLFGETGGISTFEPEGATMLGPVALLRYRGAWRLSHQAGTRSLPAFDAMTAKPLPKGR
jgi:dihydrofolate reductase